VLLDGTFVAGESVRGVRLELDTVLTFGRKDSIAFRRTS
jgi:hypothetical protein